MECPRCGGLLVEEWADGLRLWRCIQCGFRDDDVMRHNRQKSQAPAWFVAHVMLADLMASTRPLLR